MHIELPGDQLLLVAGALLAIGVLTAGLAQRLRAPSLLLFLGLGMVLGTDGLHWIDVGFDDLRLIQSFATTALVLILYEGGLSTPVAAFRRVVAPGLVLATVGVAITAGIAGLATHLVLHQPASTSLMIGAVIASTDAAAVFSAMRGAPLPSRVRQLLQVESGLNDPMAILLTIGAIEAWRASPTAADWVEFGVVQLGGGAAIGLAVAFAGAWVLNRSRLGNASAYPVFALAVAGVAYGASAAIGASGFLAVYVAGLTIGARVPRHRRLIRSFHDSLGSVAEIGLFLLLGLLVNPSELTELAGRGLVIAAVLVFVARPIAVGVCLPWFRTTWQETTITAWAGLRGAVPIVLATFPLSVGHPQGVLIFDIVFFVVLLSALVQGLTVTPLARWLGLEADPSPWEAMVDVVPLDRVQGDLVEVELDPGSPVIGHALATVPLPDKARIAAIFRADEVVVPTGATVLAPGDRLLVVTSHRSHAKHLVTWAAGTP
ncbi:potassium/proton antiporter [Aquihabitans sp. McL0605]|uniref:potassium/proton antiporter n=1 Tax=Aquihabitans sp. McL0605 TaxID=3415671 RepID=UPI003CF921D5